MEAKSIQKGQRNGSRTNFLGIGCLVVSVALGMLATNAVAFQEGDFWEYGWDSYKYSWMSGSDPSTSRDSGSFLVILGSPVQISGKSAYEVHVVGDSSPRGSIKNFAPRWRYLAEEGRKILGSENGTTLVTIFDGQAGQWNGGGFFTSWSSGTQLTAIDGYIDNDYIAGEALNVGDSASQSLCEWIAGHYICANDTAYDVREYEYFIEGIGPVGYYRKIYASYTNPPPSVHKTEYNVGLIASSFWGDSAPSFEWEVESNNYPNSAQAVSLPAVIVGEGSVGSGYSVGFGCGFPKEAVEDWYTFTLTEWTLTLITLTIDANADLDLALLRNASGTWNYQNGPVCLSETTSTMLQWSSTDDNVGTGVFTEQIYINLRPATYYIGVSTFDHPQAETQNVGYMLELDVPDYYAPTPTPSTWATSPHATGENSIAMTATTASDYSGVEYYFDCLTSGGHDSGWQNGPNYEDTGLSLNTAYTYRVRARDKSTNQNMTVWSVSRSATTDAPDLSAPTPNRMTWATVPGATGSSSISMTATSASDPSGVQYQFDETTGNPGGSDSGWQNGRTYNDTGLSASTSYTYRVRTRDKSPNKNTTAWSVIRSATTDARTASNIAIEKCKVKAGKTRGKDGITFSGLCYATTGDLEGATLIDIWVMSDTDGYEAYDEQLHIDHAKIKKGKYSHKDKAKGISFKLDTVKHKFSLQVKNVALTGLDSPLTLEIEIGDYYGAGSADETVVNGKKKPIPMQLMNSYADRLRVDKIKVKEGKKKPSTDSLSVKGGFSLKDEPSEISSMTLSLGGQPFVIPGDKFTYKLDKKSGAIISASCKSDKKVTPQFKAKFDFVKCAYSVSIKKAELDTTSGQTTFGVLIDMTLSDSDYDQSVEVDLD